MKAFCVAAKSQESVGRGIGWYVRGGGGKQARLPPAVALHLSILSASLRVGRRRKKQMFEVG